MLLGQRVVAEVEKAGLPARVGIAGSKLAARVAASLPESPKVVGNGKEAEFLAPLPLDRLAPEMEIGATLAQWGIRSIGELARLPEGEVASRLGEIGRELHATARGFDPRPIEPRVPPLSISEGMELEWPLVTLEPFLFVGHAALDRLVARLDSQALACTRLEVTLKLEGKAESSGSVLFAFDLTFAGMFRIQNVPKEHLHALVERNRDQEAVHQRVVLGVLVAAPVDAREAFFR